jgi:hypothetical protein
MTPRISTLFGRLEQAGLPFDYVRRLLPSWATDQALDDEAAEPELKLALARRFGLDIGKLFDPESRVDYALPRRLRFKRSIHAYQQDLTVATSIAASVSRIVADACPWPYTPIPLDPLELRTDVLATTKAKWPSLNAMVFYALQKGIPTVHLPAMPDGMPRMDAVVTMQAGRPVIVLSKDSPYRAWQLFIVTHELAHCALGHLAADEMLIDEHIGESTYLRGQVDPDELAADEYALTVLNGAPKVRYVGNLEHANAASLASSAMELQRAKQVDAGHIILNFGHTNNAWGMSVSALKLLGPQDAPKEIDKILLKYLDRDRISEDAFDFVSQVTGLTT